MISDIPPNLTLGEAIGMLERLGFRCRSKDGRHDVWMPPRQGIKGLTLARTGKGGRSSPAPSYVRAVLRQAMR